MPTKKKKILFATFDFNDDPMESITVRKFYQRSFLFRFLQIGAICLRSMLIFMLSHADNLLHFFFLFDSFRTFFVFISDKSLFQDFFCVKDRVTNRILESVTESVRDRGRKRDRERERLIYNQKAVLDLYQWSPSDDTWFCTSTRDIERRRETLRDTERH